MLYDQLGDGGVVGGRHVEGGCHDLALDGALHVRDLLGALVHQQAEEVHLRVVGGNGLADVLEHRGLARLGGRDYEAALTLADGCHQVYGAAGNGVLAVLHDQALVGVDGCEVAEAGALLGSLRREAVDGLDLAQGRELVAGLARHHGASNLVTGTQGELANHGLVHEGVVVALHVVAGAQYAVALVLNLQHAFHRTEALGQGGRLVDGGDELRLAQANVLHVQLGRLAAQLGNLHDLQVLHLEGGLDGLVLVVAVVAAATALAVVAVVADLVALAVAVVAVAVAVALVATAAATVALLVVALVLVVLALLGLGAGGLLLAAGLGLVCGVVGRRAFRLAPLAGVLPAARSMLRRTMLALCGFRVGHGVLVLCGRGLGIVGSLGSGRLLRGSPRVLVGSLGRGTAPSARRGSSLGPRTGGCIRSGAGIALGRALWGLLRHLLPGRPATTDGLGRLCLRGRRNPG